MAQTQLNFISALAGQDLHTSAHLIVKLDPNGKAILAAAATDDIVGVLEETQQAASGISTSGGGVSIAHVSGAGTGEVIAGASIAKGAFITSNASAQAVTAVQTAGGTAPSVRVFGRTRYAANSGDLVEYEKMYFLY
jgi:hypothetical protein